MLYPSERPGVNLRNLTPGRWLYAVIVSLTSPMALSPDTAGKTCIVTGKDSAKYVDE